MNIPWYVHWYVHVDLMDKNIRKIVKNGRGSYYVNIPKEIMADLGWRERQKLVVKRRGSKITIEDWKEE